LVLTPERALTVEASRYADAHHPRGNGIPAATTSSATASLHRRETPLPQTSTPWERHPCRAAIDMQGGIGVRLHDPD